MSKKERLKKAGWKPAHSLEMDDWISPYTLMIYTLEQALRIEEKETK